MKRVLPAVPGAVHPDVTLGVVRALPAAIFRVAFDQRPAVVEELAFQVHAFSEVALAGFSVLALRDEPDDG